MKALVDYLSNLIGEKISDYKPISGGDISRAFLLRTSKTQYFLKVNSGDNAHTMFLREMSGLKVISKTNTIKTPKVFKCGIFKDLSFLLMEYIERKSPSNKDFELLGNQLALLHNVTKNEFGFEEDNFIGSLPQSNQKHNSWINFYLEERVIPQIQFALSNNLLSSKDVPSKQSMNKVCKEFFKDINPSFLHGDLWSGNFLIASDGTPYLIDPAVYYGHHEVDIAMSKLFGGFGMPFYKAYQEHFQFDSLTDGRIELYHLYYLLVHLNLFGSSYVGSVNRILFKYF